FQENVPAFGTGQLESSFDQGHQDFIEHARSVQLAGGFQEHGQLFQVGGVGRDVQSRNLAEKLARRAGAWVRRIEKNVNPIPDPEFQSVIALKLTPVNAQAIHECAVLAALVDDPEGAILRHDLGMVARDARISDDQVFIDLPPNTKRTM